MQDQELTKLLEQLHTEIENTHTIDEKGRELLVDLGADINRLLERAEDETRHSATFNVQGLENAIDYFEVTHPTLTETLSKFLTILSNSGI